MKMTIADYEVLETLYETRGAVYFACMRENDTEMCVLKQLKSKRPSASDTAWFNQVFDKIRSLDAVGLVNTRDVIRQDNKVYLAQEHFKGSSLTSVLEKEGPFGIRLFLDVAVQLSRTLDTLHSKKLSHLGIKPHHILINRQTGQVKLSGFGIESVLTREYDELFNPEVLAHHLPYLSPEQTGRMNRTVDYRADMYALGASFYEMLTGVPPFFSDDPLEIMYAHIAKEPVPPIRIRADLPGVISDIILKLLGKNAEDRYQSAQGLLSDLETCGIRMDDNGDIPHFELGTRDISRRLHLPQALYGRQWDIDRLISVFDRCIRDYGDGDDSSGRVEILLVTGPAGVGKSVLIQEVQKPVTARRGYFISGKFQQFQRDIPYSGILQAFRHLVRQILQESDERINGWKKAILDAVGVNGKIITIFIPDVELIIGPQPDLIHLGPRENRERAMDIFERFLGVFARPEHPITLFLDDLQWADRASLTLIETVIARKNIGYLVVIGAYRDNEMDESHPLMQTLSTVKSQGAGVSTIHLDNLTGDDVTAMVMDIFGCSERSARGLSDLVYEKTLGNPFFVGEFLHTLHNESLIRIDPDGPWSWDLDAIRRHSVTDNVVTLMAGKIKQLPDHVRDTLKTCACVGNRFGIERIALVEGESLDRVIHVLSDAEERGLVRRVDEDYAFIHARVHEAAYSLIPDDEKAGMHARIGKLMADSLDDEALSSHVFEVTDHLNMGIALITTPAEKMKLSHLNLTCGQKAKTSLAYEPASQYLATGIDLLTEDSWETQYNLSYHLYRDAIEVETFLGHFEKANQLMDKALAMSRSLPDKALIYQIKIAACVAREDINGALEAGYHFTGMAGIRSMGSQEEFDERYARLMEVLEGKTDEDILALPQMTDPFQLAVMEVASDLGYVLYNIAPQILESGVLINIIQSFTYGISPQVPFIFTALGLTLINRFNDIEQAYRFGKLAITMSERPYTRRYKARTMYVYNTQIRHWKEHFKHTFDGYIEGYHLGIETGDHFYAANSLAIHDLHLIHGGIRFPEVEKSLESHGRMIETLHQKQIHSIHAITRQFVRTMLGKSDDAQGVGFGIDVCQWETDNNRLLLAAYWYVTAIRDITLDRPDALTAVETLGRYLDSVSATGIIREYAVYDVLARARVYDQVPPDIQAGHRGTIEKHLSDLEIWSGYSGENTLQLYHLAKGAYCGILGETDSAAEHLTKAIELSKKHEYMNHELLAVNCLFRLYLDQGNEILALAYLIETVICANRLGAGAKVRQLVTDHATLFDEMNPDKLLDTEAPDRAAMGDSVDFKSVLKASQVISGEVALDGLLSHMMRIVMENAGATRGITILNHKGELRVEAEMSQDKTEGCVAGSVSIKDHPGLSPAIVSYAARTKDIVILNNAVVEGDFTHDNYVLEKKPKSILCYPIVNQARLIGLVYLENAITTNAFTPQSVEVLGILASQIAISITNAQLYESLEDKVRKRTEELNHSLLEVEAANEQIMSSLGYAAMMQSSLLPSEDLVRQALPESFTIWEPRDIVGGDMHHLEVIGSHVILTVVDCTGHGVPGALMTMIAGSGLRLIISGERETDPAMILTKLNRFVKASLKHDKDHTGTDDGMDAAVCCFSMKTGIMTFAGATLPLYISDGGGVRVIKGDRHSLGYKSSDENYRFTRHTFQIKGDTEFYLATDGYMDQLGGNPRRRFGNKSFQSLLARMYQTPMEEQKHTLMAALNRHKGDHENTDDVTVVGFKPSPV